MKVLLLIELLVLFTINITYASSACEKLASFYEGVICTNDNRVVFKNYFIVKDNEENPTRFYSYPNYDLSSHSLKEMIVSLDGSFNSNDNENYQYEEIISEKSLLKLPKDLKKLTFIYVYNNYEFKLDNLNHYLPVIDLTNNKNLETLEIRFHGYNGEENIISHISENGLKLPNSLKNLTIRLIDVFEDNFEFTSQINNLEELKLVNVGLTIDSIFTLPNLKHLQVLHNSLNFIPLQIFSLETLETLIFDTNEIIFIPKNIENLKNLKKLDISNSKIYRIPEVIGELKNLEELILSNNKITEIPTHIRNLKKLTNLDLHSNKITKISSQIGNLGHLVKLYLGSNKLSEIPTQIGNLRKLQYLEVNNNYNITKLPTQIGNLKNLVQLIADNNKITEIPKQIGNLKNLRYLSLNNNNLKTLPPELVNCTNLKQLNIMCDSLTRIPKFFENAFIKDYCEVEVYVSSKTCIPKVIFDNNDCIDFDPYNICKDDVEDVEEEVTETSECPKAEALGYPCCSHCKISYKDENGYWGIENKDYCGIPITCSN